ncbi:unnamed protein product [Rotaria socialis]|uniref:Uncharacterized protein n=1 Tax=Rotaria socialis TaxID=392032 RepID=A0A818TJL8_9BILA|nr:unnamed protein product [Rotaria socialis]
MLAPIEGYEDMPIVSLEEAVKPLVAIVPKVGHNAFIVKQNCKNPADILTTDESASIILYTYESSAPAGASVGFSANSYGQESSFGVSSGLAGGAGASGAEFVSGGAGGSEAGFGGSSFESSNFSSGGGAGFEGGFAAGGGGGFGGSSFESSSFSSGGAGGASGVFQQVDASRDGRFDFNESGNFVGQNLGGGSSQESYSSSFSY